MIPRQPWGVVHCVFSIAYGGQEMVILSLAAGADRRKFAPRVLCLHRAGDLAPRFEQLGIPVDVLDPPVGGNPFATLAAMRRYLRAHRPAILHTHNPTPHQYGALARLVSGVPVVVHTKHGRNQLLSTRGVLLERLAGRLTDAVVPVSLDAAEVARRQEGVRADRIHVIHNGIDIGAIAPRGDRPGQWHAVHVARLNEVKDQVTLLRAVRLVLDREPRFRLSIVGDGEERPALERLAGDLRLGEAVRFLGFRDDVHRFLAEADLFVLSSVSEGIAITLLEAMAAALPVVATDVGGNREVIVPGTTGLLVPPRSPQALAEAILQVLSSDERARCFGLAGRRRVEEHFALDTTIASYEALYLDLLRRRFGAAVTG